MGITNDHCGHTPDAISSTIDIYFSDEIRRAQKTMDVEIARLKHMSNLMTTLSHGIKGATTSLRQGIEA